ncbi:hypothetical protein C8J56DRAFT_1060138 [Mycena floridula]|nr:hypothetical protein C8J56DRAFT_1060138 [Mycena floridula]
MSPEHPVIGIFVESEDTVAYRQDIFLPAMKKYQEHLIGYVIGDVSEKEQAKDIALGERKLVLIAHDGKSMSWVFQGQPKGMKQVLSEHGLFKAGVKMQWKKSANRTFCARKGKVAARYEEH